MHIVYEIHVVLGHKYTEGTGTGKPWIFTW